MANSLWLAEQSSASGVYMTSDVFGAVGEWFDAVRVDSGSEPAGSIWQAIASRGRPWVNRIDFVGRQVELLQLRSMLMAVLAAGRGCMVRIVGEAGIGKTRLAEEVASHRGATWLSVRVEFDELKANCGPSSIAGSFVAELLRVQGFKATNTESLVAELERHGCLEKKNFAFFYDLLNVPIPVWLIGQYSLLDEQARKLGKQAAALDLVARLSRRAPIVIIVDNAEQADHLELCFIGELARITATHPVAVLLTSRLASLPAEAEGGSRSSPAGLVLPLGSLPYDECRQIAAQFCAADKHLMDDCILRSGGNPLFLVQLLQHADASAGGAIPATIMDAINSRLASLPNLKARVLLAMGLTASATSVAGEAVALLDGADNLKAVRARLVLAKCWLSLDRYGDALNALDVAEAIARRGGFTAELAQVHHLRGSVYFPQGRIEDCHRQHSAAYQAARKSNSAETELRALSGLGDAEYARGRMRSAHELFRQCVEMSDARGWRRGAAENHHMVATAAHYFLPLGEALREGCAALERARQIAHHRAKLCCHSFLGVILFDLCQFDEVLRHVEQAQILARELNARRFEPLNLTYRAKVHRLSQEHAQARAVIEAALAISEEVGMSYNGARVLGEAALNEPDPARRKAILAKGEALLAAGCIGSNHLWFYRDAIDACLERDDAAEALRFAAALGRYASQEPMVWTDTVVRRCEHLVAARDGGAQSAKDITEMVAAFGYRSLAAGIPGRAPSLSAG